LDLTISIVTYNSRNYIEPCLGSILSATQNIQFEVWVVDNNSRDGSADIVRDLFPSVHLIRNKKNLGFGQANNVILEAAKSRYSLVMNPDVLVPRGSLESMVAFMDSHQKAGVLGCKLLNTDETLQFSCRRYPRLSWIMARVFLLDRLSPEAAGLRRYFMMDWDHDSASEVEWVTAACMMFRQGALQQTGLFDKRFFMYYEDVDLCRRIGQKWKVHYCPHIHMIHHHRQESHGLFNLRCRLWHLRSAILYFQKWGF
jgi:GT2 family glycosyltransferase